MQRRREGMTTLALLSGKMVPLRQKSYNEIGDEECEAAVRVMRSRKLSGFIGRAGSGFLGGEEVLELEREFCQTFGVSNAVSFNSASTALQAAVAACGIGPGDEVITTSYTMSASASAILLNNAIPVFADIDDRTYGLDPASVARRISPRTRAILAVNLFGGTPDYDALQRIAQTHELRIIEDNAQAPGATYKGKKTGTFTDIAVFSLNVHKVIQCGEGGVITTNDPHLARRAQLVRNHGEVVVDDVMDEDPASAYEPIVGSNYRLSEVHAAIAREQLKKLDRLNAIRQKRVARLTEGLKHFSWIIPWEDSLDMSRVYYLYPFRFRQEAIGFSRKTFAAAMKAEGFPLGVGYVKPIYLMPVYQQKRMFPGSQFPFVSTEYPSSVSYDAGICPVTERLYERELLATTVYQPPNTEETIDAFLDTLACIEKDATDLRDYDLTHA
jgi:perosamine synthetase